MQYPVLKAGDRVYIKSTAITVCSNFVWRVIMLSGRKGTIVVNRRRIRGEAPYYSVIFESAQQSDFVAKIYANHLLKIKEVRDV